MSRYDDDYDNEEAHDDDDLEEEDGVHRSTSNPFSTRPNSVRGAGLPQRPAPNQNQGGSGSGSVPSPIRSPGANPALPNNRPSNPPSGGSSPTNRPTNPLAGNSPGGVQPYNRSTLGRPDDKKDEPHDRSAAVNRALNSFGSSDDRRDERKDEKSSGGGLFGSRGGGDRNGGERRDEKPVNNPSNPFGARSDRPDDRRDDRNNSSNVGGLTRGLGGVASRFGDDKKDEKPSGGLGGLTSRFGGGDKKDNKSAGGLGGLTSRFGGGDKKDDKKDNKSAGLGGLTSRFGGDRKDDKKDNKPAGGLGGLTSRFGGGDKKDNQPAATSFGANRPNDQFGSRQQPQSPLGGAVSRGAKPETSSALGGTSRTPFGAGNSPSRPIGNKAPAPSLGDRLKGLNPFGGGQKKDTRQPARSRASKAPKVDQGGLSLDNKLDILGVSLLLGSLVLLLSSLSPTKGALTESVNHDLSYVFGWGAAFVLMVTFAIGMWLILRHFGEEAPVIRRTRLIGMAMLFLGILVMAQFIDSFQYQVGAGQNYLGTLKTVFLPIAYTLGRGGGWIGGEIYFQLISNFSEIGGFMVLIGWLLVGLMLALSLSASDLAIVVVSNVRNLRDVLSRRRQRAAAERASKQQALAVATQQISIANAASTPSTATPALPIAASAASPSAPALPALTPTLEDQRRIPITTAGRTSSVAFRASDTADADAIPLPLPAALAAQSEALVPEKSGLFGGIGSRVRAAIPGGKPAEAKPVEKAAALRGRLFNRSQETVAPGDLPPQPATTIPPLAMPVPAAATTANSALPPAQTSSPTQPPGQPPAPARGLPRLGDLLGRSSAPAAASPSSPSPTDTADAPVVAPAASAAPVANGAANGVQPFARSPLTRPDLSANGGTSKPADSPRTPSPDLQSLLPQRRSPAEAPKAAPAEVGRTASPAFGKPDNPPFAMPTRSAPAASSASSPDAPPAPPRRPARAWKMPEPSALLASGVDEAPDHEALLKRAHIIEETLLSFGAPGRVIDVRTGPVVTQFGVEPDYVPGRGGKKNRVKVGAIAALDKDLQLALGAKSIRIEAPVPGKGYVGIEVPNDKAEIVHLRDVLESAEFKKIKSPLAIALGQGVDGTPVAADLSSMPHLLIAGTTGSGKSVLVNAIIAGLLLSNTPRTLKFVMVDPKRVELTQYNGVPHLVAPVVVELERIVSVLKWVTREMDERYRKFSNAAARNIEDFNKHLPSTDEPMPYIVVIIDELADLMMLAPDDTERVITRIAALARATGIHLVIATQRPSVDVVTGLIKANFPARVAFAVAGNTDSRVILDQPGAERLLGRGDMLYMSGDSPAPVRLQGVYLSDNEIGNITRFWRGQMTEQDLIAASRPIGASIAPDGSRRSESGVMLRNNNSGSSASAPARSQVAFWDKDEDGDEIADDADDDELIDGEDEMYEQAVDLVRRLNKASVSLLQRRLRIGYTRAARMIDTMEERGVVGPATEGSKPREVLPVR